MKRFSVKKQMKNSTVRIIFCAVTYAALALIVVGLFLVSFNYSKLYKSPQVNDGKVDFHDVEISTRDVACNLAGEWEFFYNKWIVTDNETCSPDGMITLPDLWTYKNFGNGTLPKTGFASYRLYAENIKSDIDLIVYRHYANFAYRVFINGQLNYRSGTISKNLNETVITGKTDERHPYRTDGGPIEIVIEVSATNKGGFNAAPWLAATTTGNSYGTSLRATNYVALGITTAAVAISILSYAFFRYKRDFTLPAFIVALYVHFLTSKDMLYVFGIQATVAMVLEFLSAIAAFVLLALHFWKSGATLKKIPVIVTSSASAVFALLTVVFFGTPVAPVFAFLLLAVGCAYLVPIVFNKKFTTLQCVVYGILFAFLMSVFFFEWFDWLGLIVFGTEFIFTFELMLIIGCFAVLWLFKLAKTAKTAIRVSELECELSALKSQALKAQIEPHFIYNSLTAIQAQYRDGLPEGDKAIEQFAQHLRLITDSNGEDMIPFEDEIRNVLNYFELENLRANGKLNLLLDVNFSDFRIPVLSLQPLVENAIRHGGLREKQDGYILLSSDKTDAGVTITVRDNGKGFDVDGSHTGVGIENTRKRFALMNATMRVESAVEIGTQITIEIPLEQVEI